MLTLKNLVLSVVAVASLAGLSRAESVALDVRFQDNLLSGRMVIGSEGTYFATYGYPGASIQVIGKLTQIDMLGLLSVMSPKLDAWAAAQKLVGTTKFRFIVNHAGKVVDYKTNKLDSQEQAIIDTLGKLFALVRDGKRPLPPNTTQAQAKAILGV